MSMQSHLEHEVVILGAGPAGTALAIGLRRLGTAVTVIDVPRRFRAVEGISERVLGGLRAAGIEQALAAVAEPSPRRVRWDGEDSAANTERLVDRARFDALLRRDLEAHGIEVIDARVLGCTRAGARHRIEIEPVGASGEAVALHADFLAEARGRAAPLPTRARVRGTETVSLLQHWRGAPCVAGSAVESLPDGWAWMAAMPDGMRYLQLTLDVASTHLPPKAALADYCAERFRQIASARSFIAEAEALGPPTARTSTPVLVESVCGADWIRVGDAAMAADPLSGNGIFQALSSALQAPAVIRTLRQRPQDAELAIAFHHQRITSLFFRFARIGRDFYAQAREWADQPFWATRRDWPDALPLHRAFTPDEVRIEQRPVIRDGWIEAARVVVTPDQPLGVWHVDGYEAATMLEVASTAARGTASPEAVLAALAAHAGGSLPRARAMLDWMRAQGWIS